MSEAAGLTYPRLRPLEAFPVEMNGDQWVCLRDPQTLAEQPIFLNRVLTFLVSRMDGTRSLRDIQAEFFRAAGEILPIEQLESVVRQLDDQHYLDSESFRAFYGGLVEDFRKSPTRPARHAGSAYEREETPLRAQLGGFFEDPEVPNGAPALDSARPLRGLISPHIDFHRGGPVYAHAYAALRADPGANRYIIFGTSHNPMERRFALTRKDYDTPLGPARTDRQFVDRLASRLIPDYFQDEFAHRAEHSIEFQALCLRYILGDTEFAVVPILVGSFHDIYAGGSMAEEDAEVRDFVEAVRQTMKELPGRYCMVAGADLAHVGQRFGDPSGPTEDSLRQVERADREYLELVEAGNVKQMLRSIAADQDRRRVCGSPPIYMTLRCLANPTGKLLRYRQWSDLSAGAAVTFASVALF